jgi:hypothetical protein
MYHFFQNFRIGLQSWTYFLDILNACTKITWGFSKVTTRVQKQTVLVPQLQNLAEMLEPHLVEIKHQQEPKHQHLKLLAHGNFFHGTLHREKLWAAIATTTLPLTVPKPACETFNRPNRWAPCVTWNSPSHPRDKPA